MTVQGSRSHCFRLERVKSAPTGEAASGEGSKVYKFRANDGDFDRYQDRLRVQGWQLDSFNALQGPILYNHDAGDGGWLGLGRKDVLPIGKGRAFVEGDALMVEIEFDEDDDFARKVQGKVEKGVLGAVSVRYMMKKFHENERGGYDCEEQELLEISVVTIPGNQRALRQKDLTADEQELFDAFASAVAKHLRQSPSDASAGSAATPEPHSHSGATMTPEQIAKMQAENDALKVKAAKLEAIEKADADKARAAEIAAAAQVAADAAVAKAMDAAKGQREGALAVFAGEAPRVAGGDKPKAAKGLELARLIKAKFVGQQEGRAPVEVLKSWGYEDQAKALSSGSFSGLGSLIRPEYSSDFIELLRNETVVRKAGARILEMGATLTFDGQATAATAAYGGETDEIATSNPTSSQPLVLSEKKLTALVPIPNDLLRAKGVQAEAFVRDDLLRVIALKEDDKFIQGDGTQHTPLGIRNQLLSTHRFAMTALATAGAPLVSEVKKQFNLVKKKLKKANAPMRAMVWIITPSVEQACLDAVGPGGEGTNSIEREMSERGTILGWPYFVTNQIAESSTTEIHAYDMSEVIIGESMNLEVEVFLNGHYSSGGTAISGISKDLSVIRAITKHDIGLRHNVSGAVVTGVTWGI